MDTIDYEILGKHKKINRKLMMIYKMLSYDLLFFYTISFLFFAKEKGLTASQIVFAEAFYPLFKIVFQLPSTFLIQKFGKRKALIIANSSLLIYLLMVMSLTNVTTLIIANAFCAFGYVIKGISESTLLYDSLDETENKRELFSKYEGKANSYYYFFDAITALSTGFLFAINSYLPLILSSLMIAVSIIISFGLKEINPIEMENSNSIKDDIKKYFSDSKVALKFIFRSERLRALILFDALMIALLTVTITLRTSLLNELNVSSENFGVIFSIMGLIACYSAGKALFIHKKYKNKTLGFLGMSYTMSMVLCALVVILKLPKFWMFYIILIMFSIQYFAKGSFQTIIKQYLNSFCDSKMRVKIYSVTILIEALSTTIISLICSYILKIFIPSQVHLIVGTITSIDMILILVYMSTRVGLKPEEYPAKDIDYSDLV